MFDNVYLVDDDLSTVAETDIIALERRLGFTLPVGYHEFMTKLGNGTYCDQVYVFIPDDIEKQTAVLRENLNDYFSWNRSTAILEKARIEKSINIGRSLDGDELIFNPDTPHGVYVLPRQDDSIYWLSSDFLDPMEWHAESGRPMPVPPFRYFEPAVRCAWVELFTARHDHKMKKIALATAQALQNKLETREIIDNNLHLLFIKAISGRVQLTAAMDGRIRVRIRYNPKCESAVSSFISTLESQGFYVTGRNVT